MLLPGLARICSLTLLAMLMSSRVAQAGAVHRDCRFPMVFEGAAVNVVVLPYSYAGTNYPLTNLGNRLSLLVKLDVLSHILEYGSVGAVQMELPEGVPENDRSCLPETVLPILLGARPPNQVPGGIFVDTRGSVSALRPGHGLVLVWGLLYEEGDDVFVQTYAHFLRRDIDETIRFQAGGSSFFAKPSAQVLAFTPQKLSRNELEEIEASYGRADYVRDQPDDQAPGNQLPPLVAKCAGFGCDDSPVHAGFYVLEKRNEWIRIQYMDPTRGQRKEGWIHAVGGIAGAPLDRILPELKLIEGCAGYLRLRVGDEDHTTLPPATATLAVNQLRDFVRSNESQPSEITNAVALQLAGAVEYFSGRDQLESLAKAADDFERARRMIPYDPNAITLAVAAQVAQEWRQYGRCEQTALKSQRLSAASALSSNQTALANLSNLYTLLLSSPEPSPREENLSRSTVEELVQSLKRVAVPK